jgi:hypothetical protein
MSLFKVQIFWKPLLKSTFIIHFWNDTFCMSNTAEFDFAMWLTRQS